MTMTVGTTVMKPAAATPVLAPSSSAIAGDASPNTGPVMGTTTVGTTAMRHMLTVPTRPQDLLVAAIPMSSSAG